MKMTTKLLLVAIALTVNGRVSAQSLNVLATVPDLADVARRIGGDQVTVTSLTEGTEDIHLVPIRPSMFAKARAADLFLEVGLDLEHAWVPALLQNARNPKIRPGSAGFVNCSTGIAAKNVPTELSRAQGTDLHPSGNPHVNLDPEGMRRIARNIHAAFVVARPDEKAVFDRGLAAFEAELDKKLAEWAARLAPFRGAAFIEHHDAWVYFADRFGFRIVARLEPKPGLAPTPAHLASVIETARTEKVGLVVAKPGSAGTAEKVAAECGAKAAALPLSSSASDASWFAFMDRVVETFATHLRR